MTIVVTRDTSHPMQHRISIRGHTLVVDEGADNGGQDAGPTPHDLYDAALGACKALTVLWYAKRKHMPVEDIRSTVERDDRDERNGTYRLHVSLALGGPLDDAQRAELLAVAEKCPLHKLMTKVTTEITTTLEPAPHAGTSS